MDIKRRLKLPAQITNTQIDMKTLINSCQNTANGIMSSLDGKLLEEHNTPTEIGILANDISNQLTTHSLVIKEFIETEIGKASFWKRFRFLFGFKLM